jgi:hypothetical protein
LRHGRGWPLIGRDEELRTIAQARADAACRGVVLFAPAGSRKSRLARAALAAADVRARSSPGSRRLSIRTVETHLYRAMQKLGVNDRREL